MLKRGVIGILIFIRLRQRAVSVWLPCREYGWRRNSETRCEISFRNSRTLILGGIRARSAMALAKSDKILLIPGVEGLGSRFRGTMRQQWVGDSTPPVHQDRKPLRPRGNILLAEAYDGKAFADIF
jgi:hypothetical protein